MRADIQLRILGLLEGLNGQPHDQEMPGRLT